MYNLLSNEELQSELDDLKSELEYLKSEEEEYLITLKEMERELESRGAIGRR